MSRALDLLAAGARDSLALHDGVQAVTWGQARNEADVIARCLGDDFKKLVVIESPRTLAGALSYLAALRSGHAVMLLDSAEHGDLRTYIERLRPDVVVSSSRARVLEASSQRWDEAGSPPSGGVVLRAVGARSVEPAPELALVARTSGSTAESKLVKLSYHNLSSNAESIKIASGIRESDMVATSLRLDYSFGLSMVNSHLVAGATVNLTTASSTTERFWTDADRLGVTCTGMVPSTVRFLLEVPELSARASRLRSLLVAGGPLAAGHLRRLRANLLNGSVFYMYGQTEATARMTCLPPESAAEYEGSVGVPIAGGHIEMRGRGGAEILPGQLGEVCYQGPNVMLGYAGTRDDLALPDVTGGFLRTGDLGWMKDGVLYIEGRIDRQVKVLGERVNLDGVEKAAMAALGGRSTAAVLIEPDEIHLYVEGDADCLRKLRSQRLKNLGVPQGCLRLRTLGQLPRTPSGKVEYRRLSQAS